MSNFLLELRCEEIPARMQAGARGELEKLFRKEMDAAGVAVGEVTVWSTPRRLALITRDLPDSTDAVREETKGPKTSAPDQALEGFLRKTGLRKDQLEERDGIWFAVVQRPGRQTREVLAAAIAAIVRGFAWPKSMRWGEASITTDSLRWVRPLSGIVAIFGEDLVECEVGGIASGYATLGHRFHHDGPITIGGADDYREKLRACHVIVDHEERAALIREGAATAAVEAGLTLVEDEGLVTENAGLTEWPAPLLGRFDAAFLDVPPEVIQLTARVNQKYFVCTSPLPLAGGAGGGPDTGRGSAPTPNPSRKREGDLANAFVCVANIEPADGGAGVVDGNRKVLAARLADARFFWEQDRKKTLEQHREGLKRITFHEKLGTVADKVERVAKLARWLVEEGIVKSSPSSSRGGGPPPQAVVEGASVGTPPSAADAAATSPSKLGEDLDLADLAEAAARLAKADLVTEMVGEFPELQGVIGGYYARAEGLPAEVADAIRDHYKPVGQGDEVTTAPVTVAVSLADKLDTLFALWGAGERPTGSKDPFALRRQAIGILSLIARNDLRFSIGAIIEHAYRNYATSSKADTLGLEAGDEIRSSSPIFFREIEGISGGKKGEYFLYRDADLEGGDWKDFELGFYDRSDEPKPIGRPVEDGLVGVYSTFQPLNDLQPQLVDFFADRLKVQQREAGVRHDLIDAVFACPKADGGNEDDLVRLLARVKALQNFIATEDGANLLVAYKRAANILKKEDWATSPLPSGEGPGVGGATSRPPDTHPQPLPSREGALDGDGIPQTGEEDPLALVDDPDLQPVIAAKMAERHAKELSYTPEPAESALIAALDSAEPRAAAAVEAEHFEGAMAALASLRTPIDTFFDEVTVNDENPRKRAARLDLLLRFRDAVHRVADFSRIEG